MSEQYIYNYLCNQNGFCRELKIVRRGMGALTGRTVIPKRIRDEEAEDDAWRVRCVVG